MKTITAYGKLERFFDIKEQIENGASFNGIVYGENKGRYINLFVYLNDKKAYFKEVSKEDADICKQEAVIFLTAAHVASIVETKEVIETSMTANTTWSVNGKKIKNNLTYAQMYDRYGMDFE